MNKLNRIIGGGAIAIAVMAMGGTMQAKAMGKLKAAEMRAARMKVNNMKSVEMKTEMNRLSYTAMIG